MKMSPKKGPNMGGGKMTSVTEIMSFAKKRKLNEDNEIFHLPIQGKEHFEILRKIRDSLALAAMVPQNVVDTYKQRQIIMKKNIHMLEQAPCLSYSILNLCY